MQKKVLVYAEAWGFGGIESYLMGLFRSLSGSKCQFKLFTTWDWSNERDSELDQLGVNRVVLFDGYKPGQVTRLREGLHAFDKILRSSDWDVVHINTMNGTGFIYSLLAEKRGVPVRIIHSHNSDVGESAKQIKRVVHFLMRAFFSGHETVRLACAEKAGTYMFGRRDFKVVRNGIDTNHFSFDGKLREQTRIKLGVPPDALLFGNPSRLAPAKNPLFQLEVFSEILKRDSSAFYLMQNEGELESDVRAKAKELGLSKRLVMFDPAPDVVGLYCALDAMIFPSIFEGLSLATVEAQCTGLSVLASDGISEETRITDTIHFLPLRLSAAGWAEQAICVARSAYCRDGYAVQIRDAGYDICQCAEEVLGVYRHNEEL